MSQNRSTRNNSVHTNSTSPSIANGKKKQSYSLNLDEDESKDLLLIDENYLQYHKDRPTREMIIERKLKMTENNMVL